MTAIMVAILERAQNGGVSAALAGEPGVKVSSISTDAASFLSRLDEPPPADVAVVETGASSPEELLRLCERVAERALPTLVIGGASDAQLLSRAVMSGARGFLVRPYDPDEIIAAVRQLSQRSRSNGASVVPHGPGASVVAVYGPKGGAGATTVATSVAVALAGRPDSRVAICDLDLQFGDVGIALDLKSANTVPDLLAQGTIDESLVNDVFVRHSSGVRALLAPDSLALAESVEPGKLLAGLEQLRPHFDVIVCDLPSTFDDMTAAVLGVADLVLLVTTPELAALKDLQRAIVAAPALRDQRRSLLVVNRWPSRAGIDVAEIERALGRKVAATIPSDGVAVTEALNAGIAVIDARARVKAAKSYRDVAELVAKQVAAR